MGGQDWVTDTGGAQFVGRVLGYIPVMTTTPDPFPPIGPGPADPTPDGPGEGPFPPHKPEPGPDPMPDRPPMPEPDPGPVPQI